MGRVVSLADYEDFASGFAGIAKAHATDLWRGEQRTVHITVAAPGGEEPDAQRLADLADALRDAGDPGVALELGAAQAIPVAIARQRPASAPRHELEPCARRSRRSWRSAMASSRSRFGAPIVGSQIVATALEVEGTLDFRLTALHPILGPPPEDPVTDPLYAGLAHFADGPEGPDRAGGAARPHPGRGRDRRGGRRRDERDPRPGRRRQAARPAPRALRGPRRRARRAARGGPGAARR